MPKEGSLVIALTCPSCISSCLSCGTVLSLSCVISPYSGKEVLGPRVASLNPLRNRKKVCGKVSCETYQVTSGLLTADSPLVA